MSLYLTSLSPNKKQQIDDIRLDKTKDSFIDFIITNEAEFMNFEGIEDHLTQTSVRLKDRLDKISIIYQQKKDELNRIVLLINSIITEYYQFELSKYSNSNKDNIIEQAKQIIRIKEHEISIYSNMKNRLINFNIKIKHRVDTELKYHQKTQFQHSSYRIFNNTITRDYMKQESMHTSLSKEIKANKGLYSKEWRSKTRRYEKGQIALEQKKEDIEEQKKKYNSLLDKYRKIRSVYYNSMLYNERLMNECKQFKREYYKNKMKIYIINLVLSTKRISEIVFKVKNEQCNRSQMLNEFLYLNQCISKQCDLSTRYDLVLKGLEMDIIAKQGNEFYLSNDYSDKKIFTHEINKKKKTFLNNEHDVQCIQKEILIEGIISFLLTIKKKLISSYIYKHDINSCNHISIIGKQWSNIPLNAILVNYFNNSMKILKLFSSIAYNILIITCNSLNTIVLNSNSYSNDYQYQHQYKEQKPIIVPFTDDNIANQYEQNLVKPLTVTKPRASNVKKQYLMNNYINQTLNNNFNGINSSGNNRLSAKANRKNNIDLMLNFQEYLTAKKDSNTNEYMNQYPRQIMSALSPFYWELSNDPTLTSSRSSKNVTSTRGRTAGFRKRMAYDPFKLKRNLSNERMIFQAHSLFKSDNDLNENSYDESNRMLLKQDKSNNEQAKQIWYLDNTERGRINFRNQELYKFEQENNNQRKKSNELFIESYQNQRIRSHHKRFKVKSAYSLKKLNDYPLQKCNIGSAMSSRRKIGLIAGFKNNSSVYNNNSQTITQNKLHSFNNTPRNISSSDVFHSKHNRKIHFGFQGK